MALSPHALDFSPAWGSLAARFTGAENNRCGCEEEPCTEEGRVVHMHMHTGVHLRAGVPNLGPRDVLGLQLPETLVSRSGGESFWEL